MLTYLESEQMWEMYNVRLWYGWLIHDYDKEPNILWNLALNWWLKIKQVARWQILAILAIENIWFHPKFGRNISHLII
jgi:hypothetical protein